MQRNAYFLKHLPFSGVSSTLSETPQLTQVATILFMRASCNSDRSLLISLKAIRLSLSSRCRVSASGELHVSELHPTVIKRK
jgi:hypothetical protein